MATATTAKTVELSFESSQSFDDALKAGVERTCSRLDSVKQLWVKDHELNIDGGRIVGYRVHVNATFEVND